MRVAGVVPILQTPFEEDGSVDLQSLAAEVDFVLAAGAEGVAFPGFASEWWKLTGEEIIACSRVIVERTRGRVPAILNVTAQSTFVAVAQAQSFAACGADALMCLPPFVVPRPSAAVMEHIATVLNAVALPYVLQYSPSLTGTTVDLGALAALHLRFPHFTSVKVDFVPPGPAITRLRGVLPETMTYLIGFAGIQMPDALTRGAHGLMGGAGHVREDIAVWQALQANTGDSGAEAFAALLPLLSSEMQSIDQSIATHKWLLQEQGVFRSAHVRAPGPQLDEWQIAELQSNRRRARRKLGMP